MLFRSRSSRQTSSRVASPALAKFSGINGLVSIINNLRNDDVTGVVHAIRPNGTEMPGWPLEPSIAADCAGNSLHWGTQGSPVVANLLGDADPEIVLNAANEFVIWNRAGQQLTAATGCPIPAGTLNLSSNSNSFYNSAAIADLDGNGKLDLVGVHRLSQSTATNLSVLIHRGQTAAPLFALGAAKTNQANANAAASGDVNRDGFGDVVVTNDLGTTGKLTVHLGAASGQLGDATAGYDLDGTPTAVSTADLDGDGVLDAIVANLSGVSGNLSILRGKGDGTFAASQRIDFPSTVRPVSVSVGDLDQDGIADLVIADQPSTGNGAILVRRGTGQ